jgi:cell division protein FtsA
MTDYIVAIDLGTSHITGVVGEKLADGTFSIIAYETEKSNSCIRRGIIHNRDNTATHVRHLLKKLESRLKGDYIDKVYVGIGGQSLHTIDHIETKEIADGAAVTQEDVDALRKQCEEYKPDLKDVLAIAPAIYYLDGRKDSHPVGVPCKQFEARYKLVVGRTSIRRDVEKSICDLAEKGIAGILVSPLALADAMLSTEEKELGCALVDFGAGVTSVVVYKNGNLLHLSVIPLGGKLITNDITSLQLTEAEAETLKVEYGSAILSKETEDETFRVDKEESNREITLKDLNSIVEGRIREIVENVYARINEVIEFKSLGAGIVIAGGASELKNLPELIREKCKVKVRHSAIRGGLARGVDDRLGDPQYMVTISLILKGTEPCVVRMASAAIVATEEIPDEVEVADDKKTEPVKEKERNGFFVRGNKKKKSPKKEGVGWGDLFGDIFNES